MANASESLYKGSDGVFLHDCDVCLSHSAKSEAVSFCTICCEHLCQSCDKAHRGSRASKDHALLTGSQIPSGSIKTTPTPSFMYCDLHKTNIFDTFCKSHGKAVCSTCKMSSHKGCDTEDLRRYTSNINVQTTFKAVEKCLYDLTTQFDDLKKSRQADRAAMKSEVQKCLNDIKQLRKTFNDTMDRLEKKLSSELCDIEQKYATQVADHLTIIDDVMKEIEQQKYPLKESRTPKDDDVIYVCTNQVSSRADEYVNILADLRKQIYEIDVRFQPDDVITDVFQQLTSLGTVAFNKQSKYPSPVPTSVLNMSVVDKQEINVGSCTLWGCTFMSDGHLVLACDKDGLKLFDEDFQFISQLPEFSLDVCTINDTDVMITQGNLNQLQRIRVLPDMKVVRTLKMDRRCHGVDVYRDEIYVTCYDRPGNGEVVVLNMHGQVLRRLGVDNGKYMFTHPGCVKVSPDGRKLFISDADTHTVTCLNQHGHVVYQYSDTHLETPAGMYVDNDNNVLVCGVNSHNVHMIRQDGRKEKVLLTKKDGLEYPLSVVYRQSDGCLAVGLYKKAKTVKKLVVYRTK